MANKSANNEAVESIEMLDDDALAKLDPTNKGAGQSPAATLTEPEILPGQKIPEGVHNPPPGEPGHRCVDLQGRYNPEWVSLYLFKHNETDQDPVPVTCAGDRYWVYREKWIDVPESVAIGLADAVEIRHNSDFDAGKVLGVDTSELQPIKKTQEKVRRFVFEKRASA